MFSNDTQSARRSAYGSLRSLDRFLEEAFTAARGSSPAFKENDKDWSLSLDVPGVTREQLRVQVDGQTLKIDTVEDAPRQYKKVYEFPAELDGTACTAKLENGVLTLTLAKRAPATNTVSVNIT